MGSVLTARRAQSTRFTERFSSLSLVLPLALWQALSLFVVLILLIANLQGQVEIVGRVVRPMRPFEGTNEKRAQIYAKHVHSRGSN
jgi:hypothetical protein